MVPFLFSLEDTALMFSRNTFTISIVLITEQFFSLPQSIVEEVWLFLMQCRPKTRGSQASSVDFARYCGSLT